MPTSDEEYTTRGLPPAPQISKTTIPIAGLLVDIYGLSELPPSVPVTCLWLLHPRTRTRARMGDIAARVISAFYSSSSSSSSTGSLTSRGLIALAFDMPNHGSRLISEQANTTWKQGNDRHALDMMGMVKSAKVEMSGLMDIVGGYVERDIRGHVVLGWSLGGHAAWEAWVGEQRVDGAVVVVGCPDFMSLMSERAQKSKLGDGFMGSKYFPATLIDTCNAHDPKGILFSTNPMPLLPLPPSERDRLSNIIDSRGLRGKPLLLLSGKDDTLVPYAHTQPFARVLQDVGVKVEDRAFEGVGHWFSKEMVEEAVGFVLKVVGGEKARM